MVRPMAKPLPLRVCSSWVVLPSLKRMAERLAWKSPQVLQLEISRYEPAPGSHTSRS